jgi:hypothetical protein
MAVCQYQILKTHKQNNTPVLTIQNAQQVIDNQNGTITIKK